MIKYLQVYIHWILLLLCCLTVLFLTISCTDSDSKIAPISEFPYAYAKTPPMGWSSWNTFHCGIDEKTVMEMANAMVSSGMKDAGYTYINIDDCWQLYRDQDGNI